MQTGLEPSDNRILIAAGIVVLAVSAAMLILVPPSARFAPPYPSTYSAASGGAKAAYLLLKKMGYRVERWSNPPESLPWPDGPRRAALVLADPTMVRRFIPL
jgi:hypothetical protein